MDTTASNERNQQFSKKFTDEDKGLTYTLIDDYCLPDLLPRKADDYWPGIWAQQRLYFLKQHRKVTYINLLSTGALNAHLRETDEQAEEWMWRLPREMVEREGITEDMKAADPMAWVQAMNNICARVREIINSDIIFA